jgi:uncharacterized protein (DUF1501 family)
MQRRKFLQNTGAIAAGSLLINGIPVRAIAQGGPTFTCQNIADRVYVMINLFGANDTLNTVIPVSQYSTYATNRPTLKIAEAGTANGYIPLDTTLPLNRQSGLHPTLTAFKTLYDAGKLNLVHGVGYQDNNRSHFKSDDLWNTNGDSIPANFNYDSGWAGQLFDYRYPGLLGNPTAQMADPPCVELGSTNGSILFQTSTNKNASILLTANDVGSYYNTLISVGGPTPATFPTSDYGLDTKYIDDVQKVSSAYGQRIQSVFNAGNNSAVAYPSNNYLASQLKTVARLIKGGSKTSMYTVHHYGYDTHGAQVTTGVGNSHLGAHANLLTELSQAVLAFQNDLAALGLEDRVITSTHSEFGRTIDENSGKGTDHGGVSTMFIIGKGVKPGVTGNPIDLGQVYERGLTDLQYDYRRIFSAIMQDFLGNGNQPMTAGRMGNFLANKAPIIAPSYISPESCYINQVALPVTLVSLDAILQDDKKVKVAWKTSSETNCKSFDVEHSTDGNNWKHLGNVNGNNNSSIERVYSFMHTSPASGRNYYRLWQYDYFGSRKMYGPTSVSIKENVGLTMAAFPNPAITDFNITIQAEKAQIGYIQLLDMQGHLLLRMQTPIAQGFNKFNFTTAQLKGFKGQIIIHLRTSMQIERTIKQIIAR